jgi:hypothetical protein
MPCPGGRSSPFLHPSGGAPKKAAKRSVQIESTVTENGQRARSNGNFRFGARLCENWRRRSPPLRSEILKRWERPAVDDIFGTVYGCGAWGRQEGYQIGHLAGFRRPPERNPAKRIHDDLLAASHGDFNVKAASTPRS